MTGEFIFALLNPALSAVLGLTFLLLWRLRPNHDYLCVLALAFVCCGAAFVANDFLQHWEGPGLRIVVNLLFTVAVGALCVSAMVRVGAPVPVAAFAATNMLGAVLFLWFLLVAPSTEGRIYTANTTLAIMGAVTVWQLLQATPKSAVDWLFVGLGGLLVTLALARPLATVMHALDTNAGGSLQASDYWATVQAMTPVLATTTALAFFAAWTVRALSELRTEADRDHLTGLLNRRGFDAGVHAAMAAPGAGRAQPAIMLVDIDNFKQVNDNFGHIAGDKVIAAASRVLASFGQTPLVGRTGGEEFALFFPQCQRSELLAIAESIRAAFPRVQIAGMPDDYPLSISIGIHSRHQSEPLSAMVASADEALYHAKTSGKNRAVMAPIALKTVAAAG
ncbi:GGDEF domain-containing protein [Devosia sp. 1566]|uniref:GGDEF domain-containing protein n=1 Tax=Devosia sp. 1566 TaxID=2499144 RepID=UPI000FD9E57C|nr:GGDEF domain-containing protein [Devosia sp. 1566]